MSLFAEIGTWVSANESLLSGLAAMIVLAGVLLSPFGAGLRRLARGRAGARGEEGAAGSARAGGGDRAPARLTLRELSAPSGIETRFADSDGIRIAFNVRGSGPPDIVFAPGIVSHLNIMAHLPSSRAGLEVLARFGRVITFDKRGQGLSDPTLRAPTLEERSHDIGAVMDAAGVERAVLLGFSEGGPMCLHFAASHPDRVQGLVLVGSTARWLQGEDFPIGLSRHALSRLGDAWGTGVLRDIFFPSLSREQVDDDTYRAFEHLIGNRRAIRQLAEMMTETDVRPLLPRIRTPALVVHFAGDLAVPIRLGRALAEGLPDAEFLEVDGVDHGDFAQSQQAVDRIRAFCERVSA